MTANLVRCLRLLTAAAVVFTLLGACGIPISDRRPIRPPFRPPRPIPPITTIRSLTGTWEGTVDGVTTPELVMTLRQTGHLVSGMLAVGDTVRPAAGDPPADIDAYGRLYLIFGQTPDQVGLHLQADRTGDRLTGMATGLGATASGVMFVRRAGQN